MDFNCKICGNNQCEVLYTFNTTVMPISEFVELNLDHVQCRKCGIIMI